MDESKMLEVSWKKGGVNGDYSAERLRVLFSEFGEVEDVLIGMGSKEGVVAAAGVLTDDSSNPLLVLPLQPINPLPSVRAYALENSTLEKLEKAAQKQK